MGAKNDNRTKQTLVVLVGLGILAAVIWSLIPRAIPADIQAVERGTFESIIVDDGMTRIKEKYVISSPVDGVLPRVKWQEGDLVKKGSRLVTIQWNTDRHVSSPADGEVLRVHTKDSGYINKGKPIMEIGDPRSLEVVVDVLTSSGVKIKPGDRVRINNWGGEESLQGEVKRIEPSAFTKVSALGVEEQRVNVVVDITSPRQQWEMLGDQFQVECHIIVGEQKGVLLRPTGALFQKEGAWTVYKVVDGKAQLRPIDIAERGPNKTIVTTGLSENDQVIVYPSDQIEHNTKVKPR